MRTLSVILLCSALGAVSSAQQAPPKTQLKVGDEAPDFTLPSTTGKSVKLSVVRGKKTVVLAFFPAAFTGGCTKEMLAYQTNISRFDDADTQVFAISTDNTPSQKKFGEELKVNFPFLSDFAKREVSKAYGVLMPDRGLANRATFVIDKEGKIQHIEEGSGAIDPSGAEMACSRLAHKKTD
jgi:peroxiredoxin